MTKRQARIAALSRVIPFLDASLDAGEGDLYGDLNTSSSDGQKVVAGIDWVIDQLVALRDRQETVERRQQGRR